MTTRAEYTTALKNAECIINAEQIEQILQTMATDITDELADSDPIILCVMNGG